MSAAWLILSRRYGSDKRDPSTTDLTDAIRELFVEDLPGMTEGDYIEHGAASLRYGFDDGPMFVVEVGRLGRVTFEEWADQDYESALAPARTMLVRSRETALEVWLLLADGNMDALRSLHWDVGG